MIRRPPRSTLFPYTTSSDLRINENFNKLAAGYLFPEIGRRVRAFADANPDANLIRLGIGDVTLPLAPAVVAAMRDAVDEMGTDKGFRGYRPGHGYDFRFDAVPEHDFRSRGFELNASETFSPHRNQHDRRNLPAIFRQHF